MRESRCPLKSHCRHAYSRREFIRDSAGLLVVLDRQQHSWPTAYRVAESAVPSVIFSPLGTSFATNTTQLADTPGCLVYSTNDFDQAAFGMKMLCASAKMRQSRCVVIKGEDRHDMPRPFTR